MDRIVVGVDGSPASNAALDWAAHHASRLGAPLVAVTAWSARGDTPSWMPTGGEASAPDEMLARDLQERIVERIADRGVTVESSIVEARAADALLDAGAGEALVVVGAHSGEGLRAHLGSTANRVALHHTGPVAVVPIETEPGATGPVVVGIDGSDHSVATLCWALSFAPAECELHAVHGYTFPPPTPAYATVDVDPSLIEDSATKVLAGAIVDAQSRCGTNRPIVQKVGSGDPRRVLEHAAEEASLLVVGAKGHSVFLHRALGSVVTFLLSRHPSPIVVVPEEVTGP